MKISSRLKQIGDLVDTDSLCLDIGCDHALLDIYLVKNKKVDRIVASDIAEGPLRSAKENIKRYNLEEKIQTRLGDGLETYTEDIDTIIISGIGGRTIIGMFKYSLSSIKNVKTIIVSPNNYQQDVRKFFSHSGFYIKDEKLVKDGKIIYQVIKFVRGRKRYHQKDYFFGPILRINKNPLFVEYFKRELSSKLILVDILPKNYRLKKYIIKKQIKWIKKEIVS